MIPVRGDGDYDVLIGTGLTGELPALVGEQVRTVLLVSTRSVAGLALDAEERLTGAGLHVVHAVVPDGEAGKTWQVAADLWSKAGRAEMTRSDAVVGIGGGAVTDLAGFVAATWLRGIRVIQLPTTMLGMVDAAVGGKTGINTPEGKNLVGSFHPPAGVICDLSALTTLPVADLRAGLAEVVKAGFIADPVILDLVTADPAAALDPASAVTAELVQRAIAVKADVVSQDLKEAGLREILNYGHTFGHAVELVEGYSWRHGDAVAVGMVYVAELARLAGRIDDDLLARHREVLSALQLPTSYPGGRWPDLYTGMRRDKKNRGATMRFVVLDGLARPGRLVGPGEDLLRAAYQRVSVDA